MGKIKFYGEWPKLIELQHGAQLFVRKPPAINNIKFSKDIMEIKFKGGFLLRLNYYQLPLLKNASFAQLDNWEYSPTGRIHWPEIDEDLDIMNFFINRE